jgi:hypothetical protein
MRASVPVKPPKENAKASEIAERIQQAGERARAEAEGRRAAEKQERLPKEVNGPARPEPTRFGDWERKGIASDF